MGSYHHLLREDICQEAIEIIQSVIEQIIRPQLRAASPSTSPTPMLCRKSRAMQRRSDVPCRT